MCDKLNNNSMIGMISYLESNKDDTTYTYKYVLPEKKLNFEQLNDDCIINILSYLETHKNIMVVNKFLYNFNYRYIIGNHCHFTNKSIYSKKYYDLCIDESFLECNNKMNSLNLKNLTNLTNLKITIFDNPKIVRLTLKDNHVVDISKLLKFRIFKFI